MSIRGRWIWDERKQDLVPAEEYHRPNTKRSHLPTPLIMREIQEYSSPVTGKPITSRTERNEDCKRSDSIPWEKGIGQKAGAAQRTPGKYRNPRFAKKRGLPLHESVKDTNV
jgi:hypothetical protein